MRAFALPALLLVLCASITICASLPLIVEHNNSNTESAENGRQSDESYESSNPIATMLCDKLYPGYLQGLCNVLVVLGRVKELEKVPGLTQDYVQGCETMNEGSYEADEMTNNGGKRKPSAEELSEGNGDEYNPFQMELMADIISDEVEEAIRAHPRYIFEDKLEAQDDVASEEHEKEQEEEEHGIDKRAADSESNESNSHSHEHHHHHKMHHGCHHNHNHRHNVKEVTPSTPEAVSVPQAVSAAEAVVDTENTTDTSDAAHTAVEESDPAAEKAEQNAK